MKTTIIILDALRKMSRESREIYWLDPEIYTFIRFTIRVKLIP